MNGCGGSASTTTDIDGAPPPTGDRADQQRRGLPSRDACHARTARGRPGPRIGGRHRATRRVRCVCIRHGTRGRRGDYGRRGIIEQPGADCGTAIGHSGDARPPGRCSSNSRSRDAGARSRRNPTRRRRASHSDMLGTAVRSRRRYAVGTGTGGGIGVERRLTDLFGRRPGHPERSSQVDTHQPTRRADPQSVCDIRPERRVRFGLGRDDHIAGL